MLDSRGSEGSDFRRRRLPGVCLLPSGGLNPLSCGSSARIGNPFVGSHRCLGWPHIVFFPHQPCSGAWEAASCGKTEEQVTASGPARKYVNAFSTRTLVMWDVCDKHYDFQNTSSWLGIYHPLHETFHEWEKSLFLLWYNSQEQHQVHLDGWSLIRLHPTKRIFLKK